MVAEKLLYIVCAHCGEPDLVPFAANGLVGRCNACRGTFVIQGEIVPVGHSCALDPVTGLRPVAVAPAAIHDVPAPAQIALPAEDAPTPKPVTASVDLKPRTRRWRAAVYPGVAAMLLVGLIVGRGIVAPSDSATPTRSAAGSLTSPLSESDNGYAWNRADYASRIALCETFARNNSKPGQPARDAKYFYDVIHSFYNSSPQAPILQLQISQPAKLGTLTK